MRCVVSLCCWRRRRRHETTAVTDREYRSQCIRGHIACLETRFVSFPRPPTTNVHRDPLNNFNMAAASTSARTRPVPIYRRAVSPARPSHITRFTMFTISCCVQYTLCNTDFKKNIRRGEFKRISNQEIRTDHFNTKSKIDVCSAFRTIIKNNWGPVRKKN